MDTYTINTNHWTGNVELWAPNGNVWSTQSEAEAVKMSFWIDNNALMDERNELIENSKAILLRLGRYISDASAAPLTNDNVEKLVKLVSMLESAENEFVYGS